MLANDRSPTYEVTFSPAARRGLARLPLAAATALYEHLTGPVAGNPYRLGKPLDSPFDDVWSTRPGEFRALETIDDDNHVITVAAVAHRRDAYRPR
jgi:mRNA interferase RelE/StbE